MPMRLRAELPELSGATAWANGEATKEALAGRPVLVYFWTVSCGLYKEGLPLVNEWRRRFGRPNGLEIVGIHTPRVESDEDLEAAKRIAASYELRHPVAFDNARALAAAFRNEIVPAYYLFDEHGRLRHYQAGGKGLGILERRIHKIAGPKEESTPKEDA